MSERLRPMPPERARELYGSFTPLPPAEDKHRMIRFWAYVRATSGRYAFTPLHGGEQ